MKPRDGVESAESWGRCPDSVGAAAAGSYCAARMEQMGFGVDDNRARLYVEGRFGQTPVWCPLFRSDEQDNIVITVYDLRRNVIQYANPMERRGQTERLCDNDRMYSYEVVRLNDKNIPRDANGDPRGGKYRFPSSAVHDRTYPYIPLPVVEKWERGEKIRTLVLTEGYFKSAVAAKAGVDIVGLGSVTLFEDRETHSIYSDIDVLIRECDVENIVILWDGDCTDISRKSLQRGEDLTVRPHNFMTQLTRLGKLLKGYKRKVWFMYTDSAKLSGNPKGIDDLLLEDYYHGRIADIVDDVSNPDSPGRYFHKFDMKHYTNLAEEFYLDSVGSFWRHHRGLIGDSEFVFAGSVYKRNPSTGKIEELMPKDLQSYIRVGTSYWHEVLVPTLATDDDGEYILEHSLEPWNRQSITDDFGSEAPKMIKKYAKFVNLPSHTDYRAVIHNCYNLYHPLTLKAAGDGGAGNWPHIDKIIRHIFGSPGEDYEQYQMGLDYIQLLYQQPAQNLPILCLVSSERDTGKTSFSDFLRIMFDKNVAVVNGDALTSQFNTFIAGKLVVCIEELKMEDNKRFTDELKYRSTASTLFMEPKGQERIEVANFSKYILNSNNETHFIWTDDKEVRFWVRKVFPLKEEEKVIDLKRKVRAEVPSFMTYLNERELSQPKSEDRMYFRPERTRTPWLERLFEDQRHPIERAIREWAAQWFRDFGSGREYCLATIKMLKQLIPSISYEREDKIRRVLKDMLKLRVHDNGGRTERVRIDQYVVDECGTLTTSYLQDIGRPYVFEKSMFLPEKSDKT